VRRGFVDPVLGSQRVFRRVLEAMAHPGRIVTLDAFIDAPASLAPASAAVCLTLLDFETPLWLDDAARSPEAEEWLRFHCGVPLVDRPEAARFALVLAPATMRELGAFDAGTDAMPDRSATLVLQVDALGGGAGPRLVGPGIADTGQLAVRGAPARFWDLVRDNATRFPRGVDMLLASGRRLAALPRTVRVKDD
jgi:alpha-D-ribose 1-methylphosphonate 5-triphosphate synthase subunit PhnH